jgi:hypothetical protein
VHWVRWAGRGQEGCHARDISDRGDTNPAHGQGHQTETDSKAQLELAAAALRRRRHTSALVRSFKCGSRDLSLRSFRPRP